MCPSPPSSSRLRPALDALYDGFNARHSVSDPVWFVHRFERNDDREIVGLIASALAFGRVQSVLNSIEGMLALPVLTDERRSAAARDLAESFDVNPVVVRIRLEKLFPPQSSGQLPL